MQQAAEREAEQLRLAHEAFLNEKLAAEANAKAAELEAKAAVSCTRFELSLAGCRRSMLPART